ncbi:hypothetical protein GE21DRAFT_53 [Neurospora crassa]|uniref:Uncharacterized protein n=1 Tax=Neurospora crassa (strain ATCC 24698 / 74-OR23-1A / CBS 708.71 / DSM 1257 / FGSC 987) TaxID=367110 RepID=Q7SGK0_NEUCR|nr:hypothetical protein NCU08084 [Neurospora crassa OR74A]EAA35979.3 hypothetical protein NCU08084 [Neurospora crassa OR74A]KHE84546.1 hypothetical protein GE21DRAFT_53 [Neurospora crassa]|eukprot:XP_965215.3 hypothetical protein NCU08084 [Neurospora crassa OR74A]
MHLSTCLQVLLLVSFSAALSAPASTIPSSYHSSPTSIDKPSLNPRLSWDDIVNGAKSLYSQAMAASTTIEIQGPSSTSSSSPTTGAHGDLEGGNKDNHNNSTQVNGDAMVGGIENIPSTPGNALRSSPLLVGIWPSRPAFWYRRSASIHQFLEPGGAHLEIPAPETRVPKRNIKFDVKNHGSCSIFQTGPPVSLVCSVQYRYVSHHSSNGEDATGKLFYRSIAEHAVEAKSPTPPGEEPRAWSGLGSRSADVDNVDSHLTIRANTPSTPDPAKDPDYNKKNGYWVPMEPVYYVLMGMGIVIAMHLVYLLVRCLVGGKDTVKYLKTWRGAIKRNWARKAERRTAKNEVVAPA